MTSEPSKPPVRIDLSTRLGWVAFFNDASGEAITRILPLYLATIGGPALMGLVEGLAEGSALALKAISGWLSDHLESRKPMVTAGYLLSAFAKLLMLAGLGPVLLGSARVIDRVGKGLRGAPRDAMVADAAALGKLGRDFGITRLLDTLGAVAGLLLVLFMGFTPGHSNVDGQLLRRVLWLALPFALVSAGLVLFWIPRVPRQGAPRRLSWTVPPEVRAYLAVVLVFTLGCSSDAFLLLRGRELGFTLFHLCLLLIPFNLLAALLALPAGNLSDRIGRFPLLITGWAVYGFSYLLLALAGSKGIFIGALFLYGAFYGLTEGVEKALLGDLLRPEHRGMGYGAFQMAIGVGTLVASLLMGWMWARWGGPMALGLTGSLALVATLLLAGWAGISRGRTGAASRR